MTRIKEDIIRDLMSKTGFERKRAVAMVESLLNIIKNSLSVGVDEIVISGFGQFKIRHKRARVGRNPKTKVNYKISERTVVTFYPSKVFRKELNPESDNLQK